MRGHRGEFENVGRQRHYAYAMPGDEVAPNRRKGLWSSERLPASGPGSVVSGHGTSHSEPVPGNRNEGGLFEIGSTCSTRPVDPGSSRERPHLNRDAQENINECGASIHLIP